MASWNLNEMLKIDSILERVPIPSTQLDFRPANMCGYVDSSPYSLEKNEYKCSQITDVLYLIKVSNVYCLGIYIYVCVFITKSKMFKTEFIHESIFIYYTT